MRQLTIAFFALLLGAAGVSVPRLWNVDPLGWFTAGPPKNTAAEPAANAVAPPRGTRGQQTETERELREMIDDVSRQRAALQDREKALTAQQKLLTDRAGSLETLKHQMDDAETLLKRDRIDIQDGEAQNLKRMGKIWAQMEAKDVATLIKGLDNLDTAAKVLACMQERQVAPILAALAAPEFEKIGSQIMQKLRQMRAPAPATPREAS